jgi:hypothetical protein
MEIIIPAEPMVVGAFGAALAAFDRAETNAKADQHRHELIQPRRPILPLVARATRSD